MLAMIVALAGWRLMPDIRALFSLPEAVMLGLVLGLLTAVGDLAESRLKRSAGAKDSGITATGHGGMLDIIDSLLFTSVFFYIYVTSLHPDAFVRL